MIINFRKENHKLHADGLKRIGFYEDKHKGITLTILKHSDKHGAIKKGIFYDVFLDGHNRSEVARAVDYKKAREVYTHFWSI